MVVMWVTNLVMSLYTQAKACVFILLCPSIPMRFIGADKQATYFHLQPAVTLGQVSDTCL